MERDHDDPLLTVREVAKRCRTHVSSVYRWILKGKLRALRKPKEFLIRESDLEAFLRYEPPAPLPSMQRKEAERIRRLRENEERAKSILDKIKAGKRLDSG